ncbi:MAG TPA: HIT family protein [Candidatus Saccharimonadales bacterium]
MEDCIFCKIAAGEVPSHKIYEDEDVLAFLDIYPAVEGFTVVIPKKHSSFIWDMGDADYVKLMSSVKKVGTRIREVLQPKRVGIHVEGLHVEHAHVKVFGFSTPEEFHAEGDMNREPEHDKLSKIAESLRIAE